MPEADIFSLDATKILILVLIGVVGFIWRRQENAFKELNEKIDANAAALHARISTLKDGLQDHEVKCAHREGSMEARIGALETQVDRYTDARFDALETGLKALPAPQPV